MVGGLRAQPSRGQTQGQEAGQACKCQQDEGAVDSHRVGHEVWGVSFNEQWSG